MTSQWVPHGLIQDPDLEEPYQNAKKSVDATGNSKDPKEYYAVHLFEDLFSYLIFPRPDFKVNSQQPPSEKKGKDKVCDLAIKYVDNSRMWHILCFAEAKRAKNTSGSKIRALEEQAEGYCEEFIDAHSEMTMVYSCTLVGASLRAWTWIKGDSKLRGFWAGDEKNHFEYYRDVGLEEHRLELESAFDQMKSMPVRVLRRG
jgi:hypothetical protein